MKRILAFGALLPLSLAAGNDFMMDLSVIKPVHECILTEATRYELTSDDVEFTLPATVTQTVTNSAVSGKSRTISIRTGMNESFAQIPSDRMMADTRMVNLTDPDIMRIASELSSAADPVAAAEDFVHGYITDKILGISMLRAKDIIRVKSGDCTEHAVLTAALLRAMKIPSRGVIGFVYADRFGRNKDVFVGHMWAEAYYRGRWHLVDSTRPAAKQPNLYIALAYHDLTTQMPLELSGILQQVRNLRIKAYL